MNQRTRRLWSKGESHAAAKRWDAARACFEAVLADDPENAAALLQLSYLCSLQGRYRKAREYALAAHGLKPQEPATVIELALRLRTFNEAAVVREIVDGLASLDKVPVRELLALASAASNLNEQTLALGLADAAVRSDPASAPALSARGQLLGYFGRFDEAEEDLEGSIARAPALAQPHWLLARLRRQTSERNHVARLRQRLGTVRRGTEGEALLAFALHKELDDLGAHPEAWEALARGCAAKRSRLDAERTRELFDRLIETCDEEFLSRTPVTVDGATPIFIVGMHRSGTTLLERILAGHSQVVDAGELYDFTAQMRYATDHHCRGVIDSTIVARAPDVDFAAVGAGYLEKTQWRTNGRPFFTDKLPSNFLNLGFIHRALPQAKILHMVRDPMDTCFSNLRELFSDACAYSYDQLELADYYAEYRRLMAHWHTPLPGRILDVRYEDLVHDTEAATRRIMAFCGLPFETNAIRIENSRQAVATASSPQIHAGLLADRFGAWRPYAEALRPLEERLQSRRITK